MQARPCQLESQVDQNLRLENSKETKGTDFNGCILANSKNVRPIRFISVRMSDIDNAQMLSLIDMWPYFQLQKTAALLIWFLGLITSQNK